MRTAMAFATLTAIALGQEAPVPAQQIYGKPYGYEDVEWRLTLPPSAPATASVGSEMFRRQQYGVARVTRYEGKKSLKFEGSAYIDKGGFLAMSNVDGRLVGCKYDYRIKVCLVDQDRDGVFEAGGSFSASGLKLVPLDVPAPYSPPKEEDVIDPAGTLRVALVYLGEAGGVLRFAHREYKADLARPAFTEELTFPKPAAFPATVAIKDLTIEVFEVSNAGIRYAAKDTPQTK